MRPGVAVVVGVVAGLAAGCGKAHSRSDGAIGDGFQLSDSQTADQSQATDGPQATDVSGWFRVTSYAIGACGTTTASSLGPAYLWVESQTSAYVVHDCATMNTADCTTYAYPFSQPIPNGWRAHGAIAFHNGSCSLVDERTDLVVNGADLQSTMRRYQASQQIPEAQCTPDAAYALTDSCTFETDLTGTRL